MYGNKRDHKKIDIYVKRTDGTLEYLCSTTWSKTCKEAKARYLEANPARKDQDIRAHFALGF